MKSLLEALRALWVLSPLCAVAGEGTAGAQSGCMLLAEPSTFDVGFSGATREFLVLSPEGDLEWQASSAESWISFAGSTHGFGSGQVTFSADSFSGEFREGVINLNELQLHVRQHGQWCSLSPPEALYFEVQEVSGETDAGPNLICLLEAESDADWIEVQRQGFPRVYYSILENAGEARSGSILFTVYEEKAETVVFQRGSSGGSPVYCHTEFGDVWRARNAGGILQAEKAGTLGFRQSESELIVAGDWNGDGLSDFANVLADGSLTVATQQQSGGFAKTFVHDAGTFSYSASSGDMVFALDADGDGDSDLLQLYADGSLAVARNDAGSIAAPVPVGELGFLHLPEAGAIAFAGNYDGDAAEELVAIEPDGAVRIVSIAENNTIAVAEQTPFGIFHEEPERGSACRGRQIVAGDFDGDGRGDLANVLPDNVLLVSTMTDAGFSEAALWTSPGFEFSPWKGDGWNVFALDVNDDGLDDLVQLNGIGEAWAARSSGGDFEAPYRCGLLGFQHSRVGPWKVFATGLR